MDMVKRPTDATRPKIDFEGHMLSSETRMRARTTVTAELHCLEIMSTVRQSRLAELLAIWAIGIDVGGEMPKALALLSQY